MAVPETLHRVKYLSSLAVAATLTLLAGCATYHRLPLAKGPDLSKSPVAVTVAGPVAETGPVALNLARVGDLALVRDPNLAAARVRVKVARAQAYDAGLLPDPTLGLTYDKRINGPDPYNGWSASLTESLIKLITHGDVHSSAQAHYAATLLSWRWQGEQVALKAQVTYLNVWADRREVAALRAETNAAKAVLSAAGRAHVAGALAAVLYEQALQQASSVRLRLQTASDRAIQQQAALATLLRIRAGRKWRLEAPQPMSAPAPGTVNAALEKLPRRRLDLLALQAGYRSANAKLRAAILAQFPLLSIGFTRASDTADNNTFGIGINLRLPFFNGNRGKIAIDRATREALNAAYLAHLDTAANGVRAVYERFALTRRELTAVTAELPALARVAHANQRALARGQVTRFRSFAALSAWLDARIDADRLRANAAQLALTLRTLLALPPLPRSSFSPAGNST
ncbi:MAG: TolC family protein [Gammaproteobacteria bacterium]